MLPTTLLAMCALSAPAIAKTVNYDFNIGWVNRAPDGYSRPVIGINNQWPIPTIEANVGDTIVVKVRNSLGNQTTSLHFHGMFQSGSGPSDGAVGVTQCPIQPGDSYTYSFVANPAGTHWYHSHDMGQYPDGLRGKMIIHDQAWESSLGVTDQIYLSMSDWYHRQMPSIIQDYMSPNNLNGDFPSPDSFLFNDARDPFKFQFSPGKSYLLRIVNTAAVACGQFHIEGYTLKVVEADGVQMQPKDADTILICAGQSYGVVVTGQSNPTGGANYIVKMTTDMLTGSIPPVQDITIIGQLVYSLLGSLLTLITNTLSLNWTPSSQLDDFSLKPLSGQQLFSPVDTNIEFTTNQTYFSGIGTRTGIGSQPYVAPKVPSLFTALTTGDAAMDPATYGPGSDPWIVKSGQVVQIYHRNTHPYPHPMHLHGHVFQVVARGTGTWDGNENSLPSTPLERDVVFVPAQGYVVLRFKADNPGVWFFHCHIDLHLVGGMAATIVEAPDVLQKSMSVPSASQAICSRANLPSTGNCNAGSGSISASDAMSKCNTVYNYKGNTKGALTS